MARPAPRAGHLARGRRSAGATGTTRPGAGPADRHRRRQPSPAGLAGQRPTRHLHHQSDHAGQDLDTIPDKLGTLALAHGGYVAGVEPSTVHGMPAVVVKLKVPPEQYEAAMAALARVPSGVLAGWVWAAVGLAGLGLASVAVLRVRSRVTRP